MKLSLYGKEPGKLRYDTKYIENCSEIELFNQVNKYYEIIKNMNYYTKMKEFYQKTKEETMVSYFENLIKKEKEKNPLIKTQYQEFLYAMDYCILQTARFGTKITYNPKGRIELTEEFKKWYQNWSDYISCLDDEDFILYCSCCYEGKGLNYFQLNQPISKSDIVDLQEKKNPYQLVKKDIKQISA